MYNHDFVEHIILMAREKARNLDLQHNQHISDISMQVGALDICCVDHFTKALYALTDGTVLAGAQLHLTVVPGWVECHHCGATDKVGPGQVDCTTSAPALACPRCGRVLYVKGGRGVSHIEFEVSFEAIPAGISAY